MSADDAGRDHPVGKAVGNGQRVRSAAGESRDEESPDAESVSELANVVHPVELHLLLSALDDEELRLLLADTLDAEIGQLTRLLENRVIDPARPSERTTAQQAMVIAQGIKAVLTGFGLREPFMAGVTELARQSCLALTALARMPPGAQS